MDSGMWRDVTGMIWDENPVSYNVVRQVRSRVHDDSSIHGAAACGNKRLLKKLIRNGYPIDLPNNAGQSALFCACFEGHESVVAYLLKKGADPNMRCNDESTPVHAAAYSGHIKILSKLIEAGGDLRLHDGKGHTILDWTHFQEDEKKQAKMREFIEKTRHFALSQSSHDLSLQISERQISHTSKRNNMSLASLLKSKSLHKNLSLNSSSIHSLGFGKIYLGNHEQVGTMATIPLVAETSLKHDEFGCTYNNGPFMVMESMYWNQTMITAKRLHKKPPEGGQVDDLIKENEHMAKLRHPNLLLLMAVCQTNNLDGLVLLYERVGCGSLYHYLHQRMECLLLLDMCDMMRQICDAVIYLHNQNFIHCYITSHAIQLITPNLAKLGNLEYMVENVKSNKSLPRTMVHTNTYVNSAFNWMAPELMDGNHPPMEASDIYSICAVIWEILNGIPPWYEVAAYDIKKDMEENGGGLQINNINDSFKTVLHAGLNIKPSARHMTVKQLRDFLVKVLVDNDAPHLQALSPRFSRRNPIRRKSRSKPIFTSSPANVADVMSKALGSDSLKKETSNSQSKHTEIKPSDIKSTEENKYEGKESPISKAESVNSKEEVSQSVTGLLTIAKTTFLSGWNKLGLSMSPSPATSPQSSSKTEAFPRSPGLSNNSSSRKSNEHGLKSDETDAGQTSAKDEDCKIHSPSAGVSPEQKIVKNETLQSSQEKDHICPSSSCTSQESESSHFISKKSSTSQESSKSHSPNEKSSPHVSNVQSQKYSASTNSTMSSATYQHNEGHPTNKTPTREGTDLDAASKQQTSDCQESSQRMSQGYTDQSTSSCKFSIQIGSTTKVSQFQRNSPVAEPSGDETKITPTRAMLSSCTESTLIGVDESSAICADSKASVSQGRALPTRNTFITEDNSSPRNPFQTDCLLTQQEDLNIREMATKAGATKHYSGSMNQVYVRKPPWDVKSSTVYGTLSQPSSYKIPNALLKSQAVYPTSTDNSKDSVKATVSARLASAGPTTVRNFVWVPPGKVTYPRSSTPLESSVGRPVGISCPAPFQSPSFKSVTFPSGAMEASSTGSDRFQFVSKLSTPPSAIIRIPPRGNDFPYRLSPDEHEKPTSFKPASHRQQFEVSAGNTAAGTVCAMAAMEDHVLRSASHTFPRMSSQHETEYQLKSSTSSEKASEEKSKRSHTLEDSRSNKTENHIYKISPRENKAEWYGGNTNIKNMIKSFQNQVIQHEKKQAVLHLKSRSRLVASCTESSNNQPGYISQEILDKARSMQQMHSHQEKLSLCSRLRKPPRQDIEEERTPEQTSLVSTLMKQIRSGNLQERRSQLKPVNDDACIGNSSTSGTAVSHRKEGTENQYASRKADNVVNPLIVSRITRDGVNQEEIHSDKDIRNSTYSDNVVAEPVLKLSDSSHSLPQSQIISGGIRVKQVESRSRTVSSTSSLCTPSSSACLHGKSSSISLQGTLGNNPVETSKSVTGGSDKPVLTTSSESRLGSLAWDRYHKNTVPSSIVKSRSGPLQSATWNDITKETNSLNKKSSHTDRRNVYSTTTVEDHSTASKINCTDDCKKSVSHILLGGPRSRGHTTSSPSKIDAKRREWQVHSSNSCTSKSSIESTTNLANKESDVQSGESKTKNTLSSVNPAMSCPSFGDGDSVRSFSRCSCSTDTSSVVEEPCVCRVTDKTLQPEAVFPSGDQNVQHTDEKSNDSMCSSSPNSSELSESSNKSSERKLEIEEFYFDDVLHPDLSKERHMRLQATLPLDQITSQHIMTGRGCRTCRSHCKMNQQQGSCGPDVSSIREFDQTEGDSSIWKSIQCHHPVVLGTPTINQEQNAATLTLVPPSACSLMSSTMNEEFHTPKATQDGCRDGHVEQDKSSVEDKLYYMEERCSDTHENDPAGWVAHAITAQIFEDEEVVLV